MQQSWDEHRALEEAPQPQARKAAKQGGTDCNRDSNQWRCSRTTRVNVDSGSLWGTKGCTVLPRVGAEAKRQWGCEPCTVHCCTLHCCEPSNASLLLHVTLTLSKTLPPPLCNYLCTPAPPTALWHRSPCEQHICIVIMQCILHSRCQELCQIRRHYIVRAADIDCYICHKRSLYWARKAAEAQACPSLMMVKLQTRKQLFFFIYMCLGRWL